MKRIWYFCGDVKVTFWLLLLISLHLAIGSYYIQFYPQIFNPLNHSLFQDWIRLFGQHHLGKIWWMGILLILLCFLGVNTGVCTLNRLLGLWSKRKQMHLKMFLLKITPSLTHICFLIILTGHLFSLTTGFNSVLPIQPEMKTSLSSQADMQVVNQNCDYYQSPQQLKGFMKQCTVSLRLQSPDEMILKQISFLNPISWQGFTFHLDMDKKSVQSPQLRLLIKRDPGVKLILFGFIFLILLMLWYFPQINKNTKGG
jgi:hypothetical protein